MTTPLSGLPYPALTDSPNGPVQIQGLATALDKPVFKSIWQGVATGSNVVSLTNNAYTTIIVDTLGPNTDLLAVGGGSWRAPRDGIYALSGVVMFAANATGARGGQFALNGVSINGSQSLVQATASGFCRVPLPTVMVQCVASDVISLQGYQNSGGSLNTATGPGSMFNVVLLQAL